MFSSLSVAAACLSFTRLSLAQTSVSVSAAPKATSAGASDPLSPSFAGFGIEPSNLFSFTGNEQPNKFSIQLLQNLADFSGAPPHIRLGGNTQDYFKYDESYNVWSWGKNPDSHAQGAMAADSMLIGPRYFEALERFPKDTPVTFGLNLAYQDSDFNDSIVRTAKAALESMVNVKLYSFEVGNEPDLYLENQFRSGAWDGATYTEQFLQRAEAVYNEVLKPAGYPPTFFEPPATASTIGTTFEIDMLVDHGIMDEHNGNKYVSCWNQHDYFYYIDVSTYEITLDILMNMDKTNEQFAYWAKQVNVALDTGLPYNLREMSSVGPIGMHEISDTFGAALWTLNFFLYTATLNIASVQMHMTDNSNASAWQPLEMYGRDPFVRPQYYAHAAMAQIIGNGNGTTQIAALKTGSGSSDYKGRIRAYGIYANTDLRGVVLFNTKQAAASESNKASCTFNVDFGSANKNVQVILSYLTADGADSLSGTSWNGMAFSDIDGKSSIVDSEVHTLTTDDSGKLAIPVRDSQAVMANLNWQLGSNVVLINGTIPATGKKSTAGPTHTSGASTAAWTGAVTTTLALASSFTGSGGNAEETGGRHSSAEAIEVRGRKSLWVLASCLVAVTIAFMVLA
ncbi:hypothetical protein EJ04DRAFT_575623 [Polyplosphaeria fusca]|uniref:Beta-glucuronidase C-terminal domain-containing protein n=1 Tax=Polyplosphaeria fusca TaxID=682080 RepID=A0A9P4R3R5_9PLEO|nr:hypothetical protein EJ04DRAFT_575623 [Polyplosphaeria fusca]